MSEYIKYLHDENNWDNSPINLRKQFWDLKFCEFCENVFDYFVVKAGKIRLVCENCIAIDQQHERTQKILAGNTWTRQIREREDRILLTGNSECGLCKADLREIENQVQLIKGYIKGDQSLTIQTWANLCISCLKTELSLVAKTTRRKMLVQISTEMAMTLFLELTDDFCTSQEFFATNWLEEFESDVWARQLKLRSNFLPLELSGKKGRKAYRKQTYRSVYAQIARQFASKSSGFYRENR